ncbi:hypothetical protein [Nocardioides zeae]
MDLYRDADVRAEAAATITWAAVLVALAAMLVVLLVARTRPLRAWDGVLVAASPCSPSRRWSTSVSSGWRSPSARCWRYAAVGPSPPG